MLNPLQKTISHVAMPSWREMKAISTIEGNTCPIPGIRQAAIGQGPFGQLRLQLAIAALAELVEPAIARPA